ncbi:hypothetical protein BDZ45DRAFT_355604 [Acephala macrosclerotiorum]|nr:hypothetical protein BDZ45DRAFT_355604 [Acephala macrosclerotiorum]
MPAYSQEQECDGFRGQQPLPIPPESEHSEQRISFDQTQLVSNHPQDKNKEHVLIHSHCPILAPTGCTSNFCASGLMVRPLEPRVGENHPIATIKLEAEAFLHEMFNEGLFPSQAAFQSRLTAVLHEIENNAQEATIWEDARTPNGDVAKVKAKGWSSSGYIQTREELQWGIRTAWRNSRKCIMRAHYPELRLVDLRDVKTSQGMIDAIVQHTPAAFNGGRILPTVFMFPPRSVNGTGPMMWSPQLLTFAGYEMGNACILGDPVNTQLTKDIIRLGWVPPEPKSRWDLLPIVAMAENDEPAMGILPADLTHLVPIRHPNYPSFKALDLNWVKFPGLSRLGFDLGGVQYTTSPFMGWFMDAEIGVRNLADTFRYNALPSVVKALGWQETTTPFEDLPNHERLVWLSRAQAELNYAVHSSYLNARVTCTSTLAASESWCAFDDQHLKEKGYRLPADPYWIAPPQGSIVPLWHRGGAPNYQPKPLIAKHKFDPVKVWKRRHGISTDVDHNVTNGIKNIDIGPPSRSKVHVYFGGTGGTASKLAERMKKFLNTKSTDLLGEFGCLNSFDITKVHKDDTLLSIVATTGHGELPSNSLNFKSKLAVSHMPSGVKYSIFGLGDGAYRDSFNGAAKIVNELYQENSVAPLMKRNVVQSDVAIENPPLAAFQQWWENVERMIDGETEAQEDSNEGNIRRYLRQHELVNTFKDGVVTFNPAHCIPDGILNMSFGILESEYQDMGHIRLLPRNSLHTVNKVMNLLRVHGGEIVALCRQDSLAKEGQSLSARNSVPTVPVQVFLADYVDLLQPFVSLDWAHGMATIENTSVFEVLLSLLEGNTNRVITLELRTQILHSMPVLRPRTYSIASSVLANDSTNAKNASKVNILLRILPRGRFSSSCLSLLSSGGCIPYKLASNSLALPLLSIYSPQGAKAKPTPVILIGTGTGLAPILSFLNRRLAQLVSSGGDPCTQPSITLFAGFRSPTTKSPDIPDDGKLLLPAFNYFSAHNMFAELYITPSNDAKIRIQDTFDKDEVKEMLRIKIVNEKAWVFACGGGEMVKAVKEKLRNVLGTDVWEQIEGAGRILCEVF